MGYDWYHEVSEDWLRARRTVLTATEIKSLVATYKRFPQKDKEAGVVPPAFAALWGDKHSDEWPIDTASYGAAARGHICEPYAVREYNKRNDPARFYHWDDCIIARGLVGFSPDALDIPQRTKDVKLEVNGKMLASSMGPICGLPEEAMEIKSFEPAQHMKAIATPKMKRDQIMQLATSMYVVPSLKRVVLMFYCPSSPIPVYEEAYTRDELKDEIKMVECISAMYEDTSQKMENLVEACGSKTEFTDDDIWVKWHEEQEPTSFKVKG